MNTNTLEMLSARDLRLSAIHECGHCCVGRHFGAACTPSIWRTETSDPLEDCLWIGESRYDSRSLTPAQKRQFALAGIIAEWMEEDGGPEKCEPEYLAVLIQTLRGESLKLSNWSPTDWKGSKNWKFTDVESVYNILKTNWKTMLSEANELIEIANKNGMYAKDPNENANYWEVLYPGYSEMLAKALTDFNRSNELCASVE